MEWRPYMVVFGLVATVVLSCGLVGQESLPRRQVDDQVEATEEPLRQMKYSPAQRRENFTQMGLSPEQASKAAAIAKRMSKNRERYKEALKKQASDVGRAFCLDPTTMPQPYAAMEFLVREEAGDRYPVDGFNLFTFTEQAWYGKQEDAVNGVYQSLESRKDRRLDATIMGIASIFAKKELEAINRESHWGTGFIRGDFQSVISDDPAVEQKTLTYLATVHLMVELADTPKGICQTEVL